MLGVVNASEGSSDEAERTNLASHELGLAEASSKRDLRSTEMDFPNLYKVIL